MEKIFYIIDAINTTHSITETAGILHLTVPAVSMALKKEEELIGFNLVDRQAKPMVLTEAGAVYLRYFHKTRMLGDELQCELRDLQDGDSGIIRLGGTQYINSFYLPSALSEFSRSYPGIKFDLKEDSADNIRQLLESGDIDLCISSAPYDEDKYEGHLAFSDEILLAIPKSIKLKDKLRKFALTNKDLKKGVYGYKQGKAPALSEFLELNFMLLSEKNDLYRRCMKFFKSDNLKVNPILKPDQMVTACYLADAGLGATFVSDRLLRKIQPANLVYFRLNQKNSIREFRVLLSKKHYRSRATQLFIEKLQSLSSADSNDNKKLCS